MSTLLSYVRSRRVAGLVAALLVITLLLGLRATYSQRPLLSYVPSNLRDGASKILPPSISGGHSVATSYTKDFWPQFMAALTAASPRCALPRPPVLAKTPRHTPFGPPIERQDLIHLDQPDEDELREAHAWYVAQITAPSFPKPYFVPGSSGIVTSAGGKYLPTSLVSLRMLRRMGSTLPVEVFLATPEEAESDICEAIMPTLGARCRVLSELLDLADGGLPRRLNVTHFQLKVFAMLFSEFDVVLWMDADQVALIDPRPLIESEPFRSDGLVAWPDYWAETMSPAFFHIAGIPDDRIPVPGLSGALETAQLLINKSKNLRVLLLAAYYNFYGPTHYYPLIGQNAYGTGDKDTFLAAALVLQAPFYKVKTPLQTLGYHHEDGKWEPMSILQANPSLDQIRYGNGSNHTNFDYEWPDEQFSLERVRARTPSAFLHSEQSKPNAVVKVWEARGGGPVRAYQPVEEMLEAFGYDIERTLWDEIVWTACGEELHGHVFRGWAEDWQNMLDKEAKEKEEAEKKASADDKSKGANDAVVKGEAGPGKGAERRRAEGAAVDPETVARDMCRSIGELYTVLFKEGPPAV